MTDAPLETPVAPLVTSPTTPLPNDPAARTTDGTLKDQSATTQDSLTAPTDSKTDAKPTPPAVPDKYEFKAAEGHSIDDAVVARFTPIFKELGLSQDAAQKLFDAYNAQSKTNAENTTKLVNDMREGWRNDIAKDPILGPKLDTVKADIGRAKASLFENDPVGLKAFNEAADLTGAGDHPAFVKAWVKIAQRINEGTHVSGGNPSEHGQTAPDRSARPTAAQAMYPGLPSVNRPSATH
jgi:hypothetical protein